MLREDLMIVNAKAAVLASARWLTCHELAALSNSNSAQFESQLQVWKAEKRTFSIRHEGVVLFPSYAFDCTNGWVPTPNLQPVLHCFEDRKSGWGLAFWFAGANMIINGKRPQDLLGTNRDLVLAAALNEVAGITHG